ncbi:hypothetical protein ACFL54_09900 [Planctomycetota bacterium]
MDIRTFRIIIGIIVLMLIITGIVTIKKYVLKKEVIPEEKPEEYKHQPKIIEWGKFNKAEREFKQAENLAKKAELLSGQEKYEEAIAKFREARKVGQKARSNASKTLNKIGEEVGESQLAGKRRELTRWNQLIKKWLNRIQSCEVLAKKAEESGPDMSELMKPAIDLAHLGLDLYMKGVRQRLNKYFDEAIEAYDEAMSKYSQALEKAQEILEQNPGTVYDEQMNRWRWRIGECERQINLARMNSIDD